MSKLATSLDVAGRVAKQPPFWVAVAGAVATSRGEGARRTALQALVGYGSAGAVANLMLKPMFGRRRPPGRER